MSHRLKPYPSYKDSGVEWLGRIPAHWRVVRSDALLEYRKEQARRESFGGKRVFHYSIPAIQETGDGREEDGAEIDSDKISLGGDELLVSKLNPCKGCVLISKRHDLPVVCSTEFVPLRAKRCDLRFAFHLYASQEVRDLISATVQSVTRSHQRANPADITKIWLAFPPDAEQQSIASFLDRETGKIDALVAKKERLIELLQEKRTALISHSVTQGLNPNAPMKDSGIPPVQQIPAGWSTKACGLLFRERDERNFPLLPILEVSIHSGVTVREFSEDKIEQRADDPATYKRAVRGDLAFNKMRMWQGAVGVAPTDGLVSTDYTVARPLDGVCCRYFELLFRTEVFKTEVNRFSHGIVPDRNRLYWDSFKQIKVLCPPFNESLSPGAQP